MRIGIFGGSFDPVHTQHVRLAEEAVKTLGLDKLFIVPAHTPPHKIGKTLSSDTDRLALCRIAFSKAENTEVCDFELSQGGTSYTFLTCRKFAADYPQAELFLLLGTDMLRDFPSWKNPEEILKLATLAVCARAEGSDWLRREREAFFARFHREFAVIGYEGEAVSSTKIRTLVAAGEKIDGLVPKEEAAYIAKRGLYEICGAKEALALEKPSRRAHSVRVALLAAEKAGEMKIDERKAVTAALFHDCAKNLPPDSPYLKDFLPPAGIPGPVLHQFAGAYVAEKFFGVTDEEVLDAIRFHTSGRENMTDLGKLVFLCDMLESGRSFEGADALRKLFDGGRAALNTCLAAALEATLSHLKKSGGTIFPLTEKAYEFIRKQIDEENKEESDHVGNQQ